MKVLHEEAPRYRYLHTEQPPLNVKLQLLSHNGDLSVGAWKGDPLGRNSTYKAWSGFPLRDKELERELALP